MAADQTVGDVGRLYRGGIESVELITSDLTARGWEQPACGRWNGTQTARHLVAVARWYHDWSDRAIAGDASPPSAAAEMDDRNNEALTAVGCIGGPEAIADFGETARAYLLRAADHWDLAFGYPYGTVTVGLHCGVCDGVASPCVGPLPQLGAPPPAAGRPKAVRCRRDVRRRGRRRTAGGADAAPRPARVLREPMADHPEALGPVRSASASDRLHEAQSRVAPQLRMGCDTGCGRSLAA